MNFKNIVSTYSVVCFQPSRYNGILLSGLKFKQNYFKYNNLTLFLWLDWMMLLVSKTIKKKSIHSSKIILNFQSYFLHYVYPILKISTITSSLLFNLIFRSSSYSILSKNYPLSPSFSSSFIYIRYLLKIYIINLSKTIMF